MPHQCTGCDRTFPDGSKEMLSGCPDCGGNKFRFRPPGAADAPAAEDPPGSADPAAGAADPDPDTTAEGVPPGEDRAQASARSELVGSDELAAAGAPRRSGGGPDAPAERPDAEATPEAARPGIEDLREELNDQFESIRIVNPGEYELNLMELYDRQEYVISLQEDGRYVIEVPDAWSMDPDAE